MSLPLPALLGFHSLAEPIALAVHLEDVAVVGQAVQQRRGHPLTLKLLVPVAERQVAGAGSTHEKTPYLLPFS